MISLDYLRCPCLKKKTPCPTHAEQAQTLYLENNSVPPSQPDYKPFHYACSTFSFNKVGIYSNHAIQACVYKVHICKLGTT